MCEETNQLDTIIKCEFVDQSDESAKGIWSMDLNACSASFTFTYWKKEDPLGSLKPNELNFIMSLSKL